LPGASVKIADDGEILLKGGHIFQGYYNNQEATDEVMDGGWFHSGDLGSSMVRATCGSPGARRRSWSPQGARTSRQPCSRTGIRAHALVSQAMVVGDGQPFIAALITIDAEALPAWAENNDKTSKEVADLIDDPDLQAEIQGAIDEANKAVSKAESIRTYRILPEDFEVGNELSQKMSVKRHVVTEKYKDVIDDIYSGVQR
jgi:long-chain acyl-CoA synthetase